MSIGCCFKYVPRGSVTEALMKICNYLNEHPGWTEDDIRKLINDIISGGDFASGVSSFNERSGAVSLEATDVNNLFIASAYFAAPGESVSAIDLETKYADGVRFIFTNYDNSSNSYLYSFALRRVGGVVNAYQIATSSNGSGGSSPGPSSGVISVNGKSGVVALSMSDILGNSGAQVKMASKEEFESTDLNTWNAYYEDGFRIVAVMNSNRQKVDSIYILNQDEGNHLPIPMASGVEGAYSPSNPPDYPVTSVNGRRGAVTGLFDEHNPPPYPVTSVNGRTGAVSGLFDEQNQPPYPVTSVNGRIGAVDGLYDKDNPPDYPVLSVNGKTGDVHGLYDEDNQPPYPVLSVNGQKGHIEGLFGSSNPPPYPVLSVNGEEGNVAGVRYQGIIDPKSKEWSINKGLVLMILKPPYEYTGAITLAEGDEAFWELKVSNAATIYPISVFGVSPGFSCIFPSVTRNTTDNKLIFTYANRNGEKETYNMKNNIGVLAYVSAKTTIPQQVY